MGFPALMMPGRCSARIEFEDRVGVEGNGRECHVCGVYRKAGNYTIFRFLRTQKNIRRMFCLCIQIISYTILQFVTVVDF